MIWHLSPEDSRPLYRQLFHLIETAIQNGALSPGQRLPSERQLSSLLKVNRSTITHALNELTDCGVLIRKIGHGTFVNPEKWGQQSRPLMNWHPFHSVLLQPKQDHYQLQLTALRNQSHTLKKPLIDLASGDIAVDLLPHQDFTQISWHQLLSLEQDNETARLGLSSFRKAVIHHLQKHYHLNVDPEEILITSGTQQALFLISQTLLKPGDSIGVESPSSFYRLPIFQAAGLRVCALPMDDEGITLDGFRSLVEKSRIKMIFLNPIFQNPTGLRMHQERKKTLLKECVRYQIPLVEDDTSSLLYFNNDTDIQPIKFYDEQNQVIYLGSLSKYIGNNIRAGWIVAPRNVITRLADTRQQIDGGLSVLPQLLAEHYLIKQINNHCHFLRKKLLNKANTLEHWLSKQAPFPIQFRKPEGGLYLYAYFDPYQERDITHLLDLWLKENITAAKGEYFGDKIGKLRLNISQWPDHAIGHIPTKEN